MICIYKRENQIGNDGASAIGRALAAITSVIEQNRNTRTYKCTQNKSQKNINLCQLYIILFKNFNIGDQGAQNIGLGLSNCTLLTNLEFLIVQIYFIYNFKTKYFQAFLLKFELNKQNLQNVLNAQLNMICIKKRKNQIGDD
ncbi:hypothetical protein TTHERM_01080340 (macronuclear) [Tetrahymena thermophila SB210]|uniref:Uncharacterized protein n=1 Tax=Tetrahymena thermophila (strain SB210) TaxID=312017 RepID=Q22C36_TETTS|nr:hypothetical protein TTHERM_01080340 [Tetrahymena thermophila SB210]EAR82826.2 hypothetical protein TTHERM_01080340 [Tetrahymena thermophila SB210]|eukprot:XP_001030489.2 hypothetical protein TTHERM_01080340 [Tetrahymena thermophila SB210]